MLACLLSLIGCAVKNTSSLIEPWPPEPECPPPCWVFEEERHEIVDWTGAGWLIHLAKDEPGEVLAVASCPDPSGVAIVYMFFPGHPGSGQHFPVLLDPEKTNTAEPKGAVCQPDLAATRSPTIATTN